MRPSIARACWETHWPNALDLLLFVPYLSLNAWASCARSARHCAAGLLADLPWLPPWARALAGKASAATATGTTINRFVIEVLLYCRFFPQPRATPAEAEGW